VKTHTEIAITIQCFINRHSFLLVMFCILMWLHFTCSLTDVDECEQQHRERQLGIENQCGPNAVLCRTTGTGGNSVMTMECVCRRGWTTPGSKDNYNSTLVAATLGCTVNIDDCAGPDVKCSNGGTCLDLIGGYACACPVGYTG